MPATAELQERFMDENMRLDLMFLFFICNHCMTCFTNGLMVYRAKENENITIVWSTRMKTNWNLINMICHFVSDSDKIVFDTVRGSLVPPDEQFAGRVHLDKNAPEEAKIRLHLTNVQTKDSGLYTCYLKADFNDVTEKRKLQMKEQFFVNVTTGGHDTSSFMTTPYAELPPSGPDLSIRLAVTLSVAAVALGLIVYVIYRIARPRRCLPQIQPEATFLDE